MTYIFNWFLFIRTVKAFIWASGQYKLFFESNQFFFSYEDPSSAAAFSNLQFLTPTMMCIYKCLCRYRLRKGIVVHKLYMTHIFQSRYLVFECLED